MTKTRSTKRALLLSALSLLMCVSMLVGSTFAWFTDSVTSGQNKIQAGNLDVQLLMHNGTEYIDISNSDLPIFGAGSIAQNVNSETLWEPGKTQVAYLAIKNNGSLSLKYKVALDVYTTIQDHKNLYEVMEYAIVPNAQPDAVKSWSDGNNVVLGKQIVSENNVPMDPGSVHYFALAIHMPEEADNRYQNGEVSFDLTVLATQLDAEFDNFGKDYDEDAKYPLGKPESVSDTFNSVKAVIGIPAEAPEGNYELELSAITYGSDAGKTTMSFDLSLLRDNQKVTGSGLSYPVTIHLPHPFVNMDNFQVLHNSQPVEGATYNEEDNTVSFTTNGFSPFEIRYTDYVDSSFELDYQVDSTGNYTITKGIFVGKNPADLDSSLKGTDSECIVVDYVKDGTTYYVVSERATSVFVSADSTASYGAFNEENVDFRTNMNGKLFELFNKDKPKTIYYNDHTTIFLLPGTFTEGTTINIGSSVDVIGLGDTNEVKVIKAAGASSSNRHLFNCNNASKADYTEVTLRNMYLDASEKTTNNKDNVSVQCIRKTKVKCYDLTINEGTWEYAFTVNANNAHDDGTTYPAYMYAENCNVIGTMVVDFSRKNTELFYYNNVTYKNGASTYSVNDTRSKNIAMAATDWIWD